MSKTQYEWTLKLANTGDKLVIVSSEMACDAVIETLEKAGLLSDGWMDDDETSMRFLGLPQSPESDAPAALGRDPYSAVASSFKRLPCDPGDPRERVVSAPAILAAPYGKAVPPVVAAPDAATALDAELQQFAAHIETLPPGELRRVLVEYHDERAVRTAALAKIAAVSKFHLRRQRGDQGQVVDIARDALNAPYADFTRQYRGASKARFAGNLAPAEYIPARIAEAGAAEAAAHRAYEISTEPTAGSHEALRPERLPDWNARYRRALDSLGFTIRTWDGRFPRPNMFETQPSQPEAWLPSGRSMVVRKDDPGITDPAELEAATDTLRRFFLPRTPV